MSGKVESIAHSFLIYDRSVTKMIVGSSSRVNELARRGITKFRRPIVGDDASA
jgi:hypothetical protein